MWAHFPTWLLGDGQVPEFGLGDVVGDLGLRLECSRLHAASEAEVRFVERPGPESGRVRCSVVGSCAVVTAPMTLLIAMPGWLMVAEPQAIRPVPGSKGSGAMEPWSDDFVAPAPGEMVEAEGWLQVVADYEWSDFALPDARMDWRIQGIKLVEYVPGPGRTLSLTQVIRTTDCVRMSVHADSLNAWYLLDLLPA